MPNQSTRNPSGDALRADASQGHGVRRVGAPGSQLGTAAEEARWDRTSHRALHCPSWDRTRTLLIQSRAERVRLEDTMSVSGCPPSIGARRLGGQCPDWSGETLVKCLQRAPVNSPDGVSGQCKTGVQAARNAPKLRLCLKA